MKLNLTWMDQAHPAQGGFTWGLPWAKGTLDRSTPLYLTDEAGRSVPMHTEPRAFWPDGSVKWTLHSAIDEPKANYSISDEAPEALAEAGAIDVVEDGDTIIVDTGAVA